VLGPPAFMKFSPRSLPGFRHLHPFIWHRPGASLREVFSGAYIARPMTETVVGTALVVVATFCSLRFGESAALRRSDVDLNDGSLVVTSSLSKLRGGELVLKEPKTEASRRRVAIPAAIAPDLQWHLDRFVRRPADARVFSDPKGGMLCRSNFRRIWIKALLDAGVPTVHFHDLRHTGNTVAASTGASTRKLMTRMGHSSTRAALIYQHATDDRDRQIADGIDMLIQAAQARQADIADRVLAASGTHLAQKPEKVP
jgi:integrase